MDGRQGPRPLNWDRIEKAAAFPLRSEFRHGASGLIVNRREFWERHGAHGIGTGMELAHQLFVAMGLRSAGRLAALSGRTDRAHAWTEAAMRLRQAMLKDPRFALVEGGAFIKRRGLDGRVQAAVRPEPDSSLPRSTPLFACGVEGHALTRKPYDIKGATFWSLGRLGQHQCPAREIQILGKSVLKPGQAAKQIASEVQNANSNNTND